MTGKNLEIISQIVLWYEISFRILTSSVLCLFSESTHSRVMYFSLFSMLCLLGLATWQVLYLRRYFKAKKLIE